MNVVIGYACLVLCGTLLVWYVVKLMTDPEFRKEVSEIERRREEARDKRKDKVLGAGLEAAKRFLNNRK